MNNKERMKYFYEQVVSNHQMEELPRYISEDCIIRVGEEIYPVGIAGMRQHLCDVRKTYPDLRMTIICQYCDGDYVISEFVAEGTHEGEWLGMKPTGKRLTFTGVDVDRIADGRIIEHGGAMNTFETLFEAKIIQPV